MGERIGGCGTLIGPPAKAGSASRSAPARHSRARVSPARASSAHTSAARPSPPIRLTRRGRVVVVIAVALMLLVGFWMSARHGARATSGGERRPVNARESVIVGPRDTLWDIAVRARPGVDPRVTVQRMIDLNALPSTIVNPGQRVYIPSP
jgi:LysM domain